MTTTRLARIVIAGATTLAMAFTASARGGHHRRDEVIDKLRTVKLLELVQALDLDEKTGIKLAAVLKKFDRERRKLVDTARDAMFRLDEEVSKESPDEGKLKRLISELWNIRTRMKALDDDEFKEVSSFLTTVQQAKYIIVMHRFQHKLRQMMRRRGGPHPDSGPGPGPGMKPLDW